MTFSEMILALESADNEFNDIFTRCMTFIEASLTEYNANIKEAELKVAQESGTADDLVALEKAASESYAERAFKTIKKLIDSFITWVKERIEAIKKFFTSKTVSDSLDKVEKVSKENPKLKDKKITVPDLKKQDAEIKKYRSKVQKKKADFRSGKRGTKADVDTLNDEAKKIENAKKGITITVSVAAAAALLKVYYDNFVKNKYDDLEEIATEEDFLNMTPEEVEIAIGLSKAEINALKMESSAMSEAIHETFDQLREILTGEGRVPLDGIIRDEDKTINANESFEELIEGDLYQEYVGNPLHSYVTKIRDIKKAKPDEYSDDKETKEFVDKYGDQIIKIADKLEKEPSKLNKAIIGDVIAALAGFATFVAGGVTGTLPVVIAGYASVIVLPTIRAIFRVLRQGDDIKISKDLTKIKDSLKKIRDKMPDNYKKKITKIITAIDDEETEVLSRFKMTKESAMDDSSMDTYVNNLLAEITENASENKSEKTTGKSDAELLLESVEAELFSNETTAESILESIESELFGDGDEVTQESKSDAEVLLESIENEILEDEKKASYEEYLEAMEAELFGDDNVTTESSEDDKLNAMLDEIISSI